jgi:hypothetical protein
VTGQIETAADDQFIDAAKYKPQKIKQEEVERDYARHEMLPLTFETPKNKKKKIKNSKNSCVESHRSKILRR